MSRCRLCDHKNPPGIQRCEKCGTWLDVEAVPAAETAAERPPAKTLDDQLLELLRAGRKIEAIKLLRAQSGLGLYEAKTSVEALAREHRIESASGSRAGCSGIMLMLLAAFGVVLLVLRV